MMAVMYVMSDLYTSASYVEVQARRFDSRRLSRIWRRLRTKPGKRLAVLSFVCAIGLPTVLLLIEKVGLI
jgi:hypothetical protein